MKVKFLTPAWIEFRFDPPNHEVLTLFCQKTGGKLNPNIEEILKPDSRSSDYEYQLWPWILVGTICLFIFDVASKRIPE